MTTTDNIELREQLLELRVTVWKQTNLNGQANLDHDSVDEIMALLTTALEQQDRESRIAERKSANNAVRMVVSNNYIRIEQLEAGNG